MKKVFVIPFLLLSFIARAQNIQNIYINLYTDSLKKGTYNYINIDGQLANGNYVPLDSTDIIFWSSDGKFYGNELLVDKDFNKEKITIKATLRKNPSLAKEFTIYIKRKDDSEKLKTAEELLNDMQNNSGVKNRKKS